MAHWRTHAQHPFPSPRHLFPLATGPFLRNAADDGSRELAWGQWGMIPPESETRIPMMPTTGPGEKPKRRSTVNARTVRRMVAGSEPTVQKRSATVFELVSAASLQLAMRSIPPLEAE